MKKIYVMLGLALTPFNILTQRCAPSAFDLVFSSGFIWKTDSVFKELYGVGIPDLITVDGCYYTCDYFGLGLKTSYWERKGKVVFGDRPKIEEVPLITYMRLRVGYGLQGYISLGGGAIFVKERRNFTTLNKRVAIGEVEAGLNYYMQTYVYCTLAFRYLFPRQSVQGTAITDFGGYGLRVGLGLSY